MKFLKPILQRGQRSLRMINKGSSPSFNSTPVKKLQTNKATFGENRAIQMNQNLVKAQQERKKLVQKQYLSPDPLNKIYQQKGFQLDAKIKKLKDE